MQKLARQNYLQAEVQTATPQKLQLMLVEAAIKNIYRTKKAWEEEKFEAGFESLSLTQDIIAEILSSVDKKSNPELAGKIASIYVFIFRRLAEAGMTQDPLKLDEALRVLASERETWRLVCEKFGTGTSSTAHAAASGSPSARLDLSTDLSAKPLIPPRPSGITTSAFGRPTGGGFAVKPPASGIAPPAKDVSSSGMSWDV